jgi:hydrogenase/urease accessory protein HupE
MTRRIIAISSAIAAIFAIAPPAAAHEFRPAILDVTDLGHGRYEILWSAPDDDAAPSLAFPADCRREPGESSHFVIACDLAGRALTVRGLGAAHGDALVRYTGPGGPATAVLRADSPSFTVPSPAETPRARGYFGAGIAHILAGADHLLFVLGLLLLVRRPAAILRTITAFTLAHSLTLALAVTAAVRLPPAPVEAVIALSLVLLAGELARGDAEPTLARRRPALLAFVFGLLHGFGFAGGLAELRVPAADLPLALAGFNLGVEAGQLAFVAVALAAWALLRRVVAPARTAKWALVPAYFIGSLGAFFCFDRVVRMWRS